MVNNFFTLRLRSLFHTREKVKAVLGSLMVAAICCVSSGLLRAATTDMPTASVVQAIQGMVLDENGLPLQGASVTIKGTTVGTLTDSKGTFSFPDLDRGTILVVTYTGYLPKEVVVGEERQIQIQLEVDPESLDEVVVVAFGTQKKTDMVGSVTTVKPSNLRAPSSNLTTS